LDTTSFAGNGGGLPKPLSAAVRWSCSRGGSGRRGHPVGAVISVQNLRKTYGSLAAVDDVSLEVAEGEIFGFLGLNGAGKTTAVECIQGLRRPDSGRIAVLGLDPHADTRRLRRLIGSQLQESALPDRIKVWEALDLFSSLDRDPGPGGELGGGSLRGAGRQRTWEPLLEQWGLTQKRKASFGSLSGGQRQRLFVALALVNRPRVVFLDEMTTGLDPAARRVAWELIGAIRNQGATVVLVTHFMDEAERLCDRLAIMKAGRIIALDSPQGLIAAHAGQVCVRFGWPEPPPRVEAAPQGMPGALSWLRTVPHVDEVSCRGTQVEVRGEGPILALVAAGLIQRGFVPSDLRMEQPGLEDVFLRLVGQRSGVDEE
jgi:ABC-2 type transport system ATP-binding protein